MAKPSVHGSKPRPLGFVGWLAIAAMGGILGAAIWFAFYGWHLNDAAIDMAGMIELILGAAFSILLGGGLMALMFWSRAEGYDR